jgi:hypothetical protein
MPRPIDLGTAAREYVWLWDYRHGRPTKEIAARERLSERRVREGISRAAASMTLTPGETSALTDPALRTPRLEPLFPILTFTPQSACGHKRDLRKGSCFVCMVCHKSGMDGHRALVRDPRTDPRPEPKKPPPPPPKPGARESRRQRRARLFKCRTGPSTTTPST